MPELETESNFNIDVGEEMFPDHPPAAAQEAQPTPPPTDDVQSKPEEAVKPEVESAPTPEDEQAKHQAAVQAAINKQHAKYREEERKRLQIEKEAEELRQKLQAFEGQKKEVVIPEIPDPYDDDYEAKLKARDDAILQKARQDTEQSYADQQKQAQEVARQEAQQKKVQESLKAFNDNTTKLGLSAEEITQASNVVGSYGVSQDIAGFLLADPEGPLMVKYLASNPVELDEVRHLPPMQAAIKLHSDIRSKAQGLKPQSSKAPSPPETLSGGGVADTGKYKLTQNATFS